MTNKLGTIDGLNGQEEHLALKEVNGWDSYASKKNTINTEHVIGTTNGEGLKYYEKRKG